MAIRGAPRIGQLRTRVKVMQSVQNEYDSRGEPSNSARQIGDGRIYLKELRGNDAIQARMMVPTATYEVWMRYRTDIEMTTDKFFSIMGTTRNVYVGSVDNVDQRNRWWKMLAGEAKP